MAARREILASVPDRSEIAVTDGPDPDRFRRALGHFATGVTVVTAMDPGPDEGSETPVGFACQAFAALSLDPPLVLFCPSKTSSTWPAIQRAGRFCINVLSASQRHVSQTFGTPGADRFGSVRWHLAPSGAPVLDGVLTWIDCAIDNVYEAGDHHVVIGHVTALDSPGDDRPLLFYRGSYTATELLPSAGPEGPTPPHAVVQALQNWPPHQDWL